MIANNRITLTVLLVASLVQNAFAGELMLRQHVSAATDEQQQQQSRQLKALVLKGDPNGSGTVLGECEGDCDSDAECGSGLVCFQRSGTEAVPGCTGDKSSFKGRDFCVKKGSSGGGGGGGGGGGSSFRIKMYWEKGYFWQEESFERKWCFQCRNTCNTNVEIGLRECSSGNTKFEFVGSGNVQVKVSGKDLCMELGSNNVKLSLQKCDSGNNRQKFGAGQGSFTGSRFELSPAATGGCIANPHHPRDGEVMRRQGCEAARGDTTSYFIKY